MVWNIIKIVIQNIRNSFLKLKPKEKTCYYLPKNSCWNKNFKAQKAIHNETSLWIESKNKIVLSSKSKLTHYIKKATTAPEKTVRELHWLLCGIKNAWSFNSQSNPMILEHFLQFYKIKYPTRIDLAGSLLEGLYKITQNAVALEIKDTLFFHLTGDGWTSINQEYFLAITAHYFKDEKMKRVTLGVFQLYGKKTALQKKMKN